MKSQPPLVTFRTATPARRAWSTPAQRADFSTQLFSTPAWPEQRLVTPTSARASGTLLWSMLQHAAQLSQLAALPSQPQSSPSLCSALGIVHQPSLQLSQAPASETFLRAMLLSRPPWTEPFAAQLRQMLGRNHAPCQDPCVQTFSPPRRAQLTLL